MPTYVLAPPDQQVVYCSHPRHRSLSVSVPTFKRPQSLRKLQRKRSRSMVRFLKDRDHFEHEDCHRHGSHYHDHRDDPMRTVYAVNRGRSRYRNDERDYHFDRAHVRRRRSLESPRGEPAYYYVSTAPAAPNVDPRYPSWGNSMQVTYYPPGIQVPNSVPAVYPPQGISYVQSTYPRPPTVVAMPPGQQVMPPAAYTMPAAHVTSPFTQTFAVRPPAPVFQTAQPLRAVPAQFAVGAPPAPGYPPRYPGAAYGGSVFGIN